MVIDGKTYIGQPECAQILCCSVKCLEAWRTKKIGPAYHRIGGRVMFDLDDIVAFVNGGRVEPRAA
jgi:hypothetical protein